MEPLKPRLFWRSGRATPRDEREASFSGRPGSGGPWQAAAAAAAALPLDALTCRLTSLDHLLIRLPVLSATLLEKCGPGSAEPLPHPLLCVSSSALPTTLDDSKSVSCCTPVEMRR